MRIQLLSNQLQFHFQDYHNSINYYAKTKGCARIIRIVKLFKKTFCTIITLKVKKVPRIRHKERRKKTTDFTIKKRSFYGRRVSYSLFCFVNPYLLIRE